MFSRVLLVCALVSCGALCAVGSSERILDAVDAQEMSCPAGYCSLSGTNGQCDFCTGYDNSYNYLEKCAAGSVKGKAICTKTDKKRASGGFDGKCPPGNCLYSGKCNPCASYTWESNWNAPCASDNNVSDPTRGSVCREKAGPNGAIPTPPPPAPAPAPVWSAQAAYEAEVRKAKAAKDALPKNPVLPTTTPKVNGVCPIGSCLGGGECVLCQSDKWSSVANSACKDYGRGTYVCPEHKYCAPGSCVWNGKCKECKTGTTTNSWNVPCDPKTGGFMVMSHICPSEPTVLAAGVVLKRSFLETGTDPARELLAKIKGKKL